jgi:hypothetical protein
VPACMRCKRSSDSVACDPGQHELHQRGDCKGGSRSSSFQAQPAHFRFSPDSRHIAASLRSATKSADARRGAAVGGERRQAAEAAAPIAADERGVTGSQPLLSKFVGRRDDLADGELHRLCVAARATPPIVPFRTFQAMAAGAPAVAGGGYARLQSPLAA